jgi:orotate phosphoribosyltransferase
VIEQSLFFVTPLAPTSTQPGEAALETYSNLRFEPAQCPPAHHFIIDAIEGGQLKIAATEGFKLKSGRLSPYFFNSGLYVGARELAKLTERYADKLYDVYGQALNGSVLFGPPYKGIALANCTAVQLYGFHSIEVFVASNRKEAKDHGEGGILMGADMEDCNVIVIDDVITNGASKRDAVGHILEAKGKLMGGAIAFDRQERGKDTSLSGAQEFEKEFGVQMLAIATFTDLIDVFATYPAENGELYEGILKKLTDYRDEYGAK